MNYDIKQEFIPGLPRYAYRNGVGAYEGVVCHATDNYEDTAENERNYESSTWGNAFTHFFVDDVSIIQVANTDFLSWGCGKIGNLRYVQIELCQSKNQTKFNNAYSRYVWLIAKILHDKGLGVVDGKTLVSHKWVTENLGGTTHSDPISYLSSHGVSWSQHVQNVSDAYNDMNNGFLQVVKILNQTDIRDDHSHTSGYIKDALPGELYNVVEVFGSWRKVAVDNSRQGWIDGNAQIVR